MKKYYVSKLTYIDGPFNKQVIVAGPMTVEQAQEEAAELSTSKEDNEVYIILEHIG